MDSKVERTWKELIQHERRLILEACERRMKLGEENYGENDVCASQGNMKKRDLFGDYEEECLDKINYLILDLISIRIRRREVEDKLRDMEARCEKESIWRGHTARIAISHSARISSKAQRRR